VQHRLRQKRQTDGYPERWLGVASNGGRFVLRRPQCSHTCADALGEHFEDLTDVMLVRQSHGGMGQNGRGELGATPFSTDLYGRDPADSGQSVFDLQRRCFARGFGGGS
jgi:hypothetical protein